MSTRAQAIANRWKKQYGQGTGKTLSMPADLATGMSFGTGLGKQYNKIFAQHIMSINNDKFMKDGVTTSKWQYIDPKAQGWKHNAGISSNITPKYSAEFKEEVAGNLYSGIQNMLVGVNNSIDNPGGIGDLAFFTGGKSSGRNIKDVWHNESISDFDWLGTKWQGTRKQIFENIVNSKFTSDSISDNLGVHGTEGVDFVGQEYKKLFDKLMFGSGELDDDASYIVNTMAFHPTQQNKDLYNNLQGKWKLAIQGSESPVLENNKELQSLNRITEIGGGAIDLLSMAALFDPKGNKKMKSAAKKNLLTKALGIFGSSFLDKKSGKGLMRLFPGMQIGQTLMNLLFK